MAKANKECKYKALDLIVISLTQYITLSTFAVGGLLTYYSYSQQQSMFLWIAVALFIACAICSIVCINAFIYKINRDSFSCEEKISRILNWIAIITFLFGILFGGIFISTSKISKKNNIAVELKDRIEDKEETIKLLKEQIELLKRLKPTDVPRDDGAEDAVTSGFSDK